MTDQQYLATNLQRRLLNTLVERLEAGDDPVADEYLAAYRTLRDQVRATPPSVTSVAPLVRIGAA